jgi:hypothetical protein
MTENPAAADLFSVSDARRAMALIAHAAAGDVAGMRLLFTEAAEADALPDLAAATVATVLDLRPDLRTPAGLAALRELVAALAGVEEEVGKP